MFEQFREPNASAKGLKFIVFNFIYELLDGEDYRDDKSLLFVKKVLEILEELIKSHPDKFENLEATCTIVINTACNLYCLQYAYSIFNFAVGKKIITDQENLNQLQSKIQAKAIKMIQWNIDFKNQMITSEDPKGLSIWLETMLFRPEFIDLLILNSGGEKGNELILLLVNNCHQLTSDAAIKKLISLFKQLIQTDKLEKISFELMCAMCDVLEMNTMIAKNHPQDAQILHELVMKKCIKLVNNFIKLNYKEEYARESCLLLLNFFKKHEGSFFAKNSLYFQHCHRQNLTLLDCTEELLLKLQNIKDPSLRFKAILDELLLMLKIRPESIFNPSAEIQSIFNMLENCFNSISDMDPLTNFILMLLHASTGAKEPIVDYFLQIMEECLVSHPEKFSNLKSTCTAVLRTAILQGYFVPAANILKKAIQQEVKLDPSIQLEIKAGLDSL